MDKKICVVCGKEKSLTDFVFRNKKKGIYHPKCKSCLAEYRKEHYDAVKDATRHKKSRDSRKKWLRDYKENLKCELCGENHPATLDFHHLNKDTKKNNINRMIKSSSIESIKEEIKLCQVLCSNCHRKLHWDDNIPQN